MQENEKVLVGASCGPLIAFVFVVYKCMRKRKLLHGGVHECNKEDVEGRMNVKAGCWVN
jgi:hypothetical protein